MEKETYLFETCSFSRYLKEIRAPKISNMLNCTDLACVLHHHHFYAHLHHLKHHLSDEHLEPNEEKPLDYQVEGKF